MTTSLPLLERIQRHLRFWGTRYENIAWHGPHAAATLRCIAQPTSSKDALVGTALQDELSGQSATGQHAAATLGRKLRCIP